jgi:hypothetical protein
MTSAVVHSRPVHEQPDDLPLGVADHRQAGALGGDHAVQGLGTFGPFVTLATRVSRVLFFTEESDMNISLPTKFKIVRRSRRRRPTRR